MSQANAFKNLVASRQQKAEVKAEESTHKLIEERAVNSQVNKLNLTAEEPVESSISPIPSSLKKRGRPANGKRSNEDWIGRTYYVQKETDLNVEDCLLKLKREGIDVDKSELVNHLLTAWTKWQQGEMANFHLGEMAAKRKS